MMHSLFGTTLAFATACTTYPGAGEIGFEAGAPAGRFERLIDSNLKLKVRADTNSNARVLGWGVGIYRVNGPAAGNLLYHSRNWHGPYLAQVDAWAEAIGWWSA